jgi:WD repeat-containing protein 23
MGRQRGERDWDYRGGFGMGGHHGAPNQTKEQKDVDTSIMTYRGHRVFDTLIRCYFSPDYTTAGRYIYTGSHNGVIHIYDVLTGRIVHKLTGHEGNLLHFHTHPPHALCAIIDMTC